jgi:hypothetical protein
VLSARAVLLAWDVLNADFLFRVERFFFPNKKIKNNN